MIRSMTGFARSTFESQDISMNVEIRALNSKNLELNFRLPNAYRCWEDELRTTIKPQLLRGKIDINFGVKYQGTSQAVGLNKKIILDYIKQLGDIAEATSTELLPIAMRLPESLQPVEFFPDDNQKKEVFELVRLAIKKLIDYQLIEGQAMAKDLNTQIESIEKRLEHVNNTKDQRVQQIRSKLQENLKAFAIEVDQNRFEQEIIFYLEKHDINEEIVRLRQHLIYFSEVMNSETETKGKKLGFIAQEIGREINTIGSKASNASLQKEIVQMKDALERIKEQLLNIL